MARKKPVGAQKQGRDKKPVTLRPTQWDMGATGPANRHGLVEEGAGETDITTGRTVNPNGVKRMRRDRWIDVLHRKGGLTVAQHNTAVELFEAAEGRPSRDVLAALSIDKGNPSDPQAAAFDRRRKFHAMWAKVPAECRATVEHVVLLDQSINAMPTVANGVSHRRHLEYLQHGLDRVAAGFARIGWPIPVAP